MNTSKSIYYPLFRQNRPWLYLAILLLVFAVGCAPVSTPLPAQPTPEATEPPPAPTLASPSPTAAGEAPLPAGWATYTSQGCEYAISLPPDMGVWEESAHSRTFGFQLPDPEAGARNFIYVSVVDQGSQSPEAGSVYNYDPAQADLLLAMQVGESQPISDVGEVAPWFTYQRLPDTTISGHAAQTYENLQPWEFPEGTRELRYYLSLNGCTYQIGGYLDAAGAGLPGAITQDLFSQIVDTFRLAP